MAAPSSPRARLHPDAEAILWKILTAASRTFRRLESPHTLPAAQGARNAGEGGASKRPTRAA